MSCCLCLLCSFWIWRLGFGYCYIDFARVGFACASLVSLVCVLMMRMSLLLALSPLFALAFVLVMLCVRSHFGSCRVPRHAFGCAPLVCGDFMFMLHCIAVGFSPHLAGLLVVVVKSCYAK